MCRWESGLEGRRSPRGLGSRLKDRSEGVRRKTRAELAMGGAGGRKRATLSRAAQREGDTGWEGAAGSTRCTGGLGPTAPVRGRKQSQQVKGCRGLGLSLWGHQGGKMLGIPPLVLAALVVSWESV